MIGRSALLSWQTSANFIDSFIVGYRLTDTVLRFGGLDIIAIRKSTGKLSKTYRLEIQSKLKIVRPWTVNVVASQEFPKIWQELQSLMLLQDIKLGFMLAFGSFENNGANYSARFGNVKWLLMKLNFFRVCQEITFEKACMSLNWIYSYSLFRIERKQNQ